MKKFLTLLIKICLGLAASTLLIWLGALPFTGRSQIARALAWQDSDIQDYKRFPSRTIENAAPIFNFKAPSEAEVQRYTPALESVTYNGKTQNLGTFLRKTDTVAFLVIKDDTLLYEGYFNGYDHNSTVTSFSVAKSFDSALVGIAISEGYIGSLEDPITKYVPELLENDPRYQDIRLRHLLSMSSGIHYSEEGLPWSDDASTYYALDLRKVAISSYIEGEPGKFFLYNNFHPLLVGMVLERTTGMHVAEYLQEKIWKPLGMEAEASWSLDSEASGFEKMESGLNGRAIDFARFGRLYLNGGNWNGVQLIPSEWVEESTRLDTTTDPASNYQYFWWVNDAVQGVPHYLAAGKHGQYIYIIPEQHLILVRFGKTDPLHGNFRYVFETLASQIEAADR